MRENSIEVVEALLGWNNIRIDIRDKDGWTALHYACEENSIESIKLFLTHPTCNKDIVELQTLDAKTAEMNADENGYQECARLIRIYYIRSRRQQLDRC